MSEKVPIRIDPEEGLPLIGTIYKGPADAAKEPVSNFLDEHIAPQNAERAKQLGVCKVIFTITKTKLIVEGPYGMTKQRFKYVMNNVGKSGKKNVDYVQIGRQAAGLFSWFQIFNAKKCIYFSKAVKGEPTVKVIVKEGQSYADFETARKGESLKEPGMRYEISGFDSDPTRANSPLHPNKFSVVLGRKFRDYLKEGLLEIEIICKSKSYNVEPAQIDLPPITEKWPSPFVKVKGDLKRIICLELYFDPSGDGAVSIRHAKIPNVDNVKDLGDSGLGLEKSFLASGFVEGCIDADFLEPIAGKRGFKNDRNWQEFLVEIDKLLPGIEEEVQRFRKAESEKKLTQVYKEATELARDILGRKCFADLVLLEGVRKPGEPRLPENGFDFIPDSIRIDPGKKGIISFKTYVSSELSFVDDGGLVFFGIGNKDIELSPKRATLRGSKADENGIVTVRLTLFSKKATKTPAILTAAYKSFEAEARVNFTKKKERPILSEPVSGTAFNFQEIRFEDAPMRHSRLWGGKTLQINTINPDYQIAISGSRKTMRDYVLLLILKETFVKNKPDADDFFEMFLTGIYMKDEKSAKVSKKSKKLES